MKVFVVGSYFEVTKDGIEENIGKARTAGIGIFLKGHLPFVPQQHFAFWEEVLSKEEIMKLCFAWIKECDSILVINEAREGSGTANAIQTARDAGKKVFHSIDELPAGVL